MRVLALLDEADTFLNADASNYFDTVVQLRQLMVESERRFRVVFAGLQNVQRFQSIPNTPLAHFGVPICVGPLEGPAAQALVREPLEAVGFRFENETTILSILSYTNYHPGLIQLFCSELIKRLNSRTTNKLPPYKISQRDVDGQYPAIQDEIRLRLDLTLGLDGRYQAIAWALVYDQVNEPESFSMSYSTNEIHELAIMVWEKRIQTAFLRQVPRSFGRDVWPGCFVPEPGGPLQNS